MKFIWTVSIKKLTSNSCWKKERDPIVRQMTKVQLFHTISLFLFVYSHLQLSLFRIQSVSIHHKHNRRKKNLRWNKESNRCAIEFEFGFCVVFFLFSSIVAHLLRIVLTSVLCCQNAQFQFTNRRWNILKLFQIEKNSNKHFSKVRTLVNWTRSFHLMRKYIYILFLFVVPRDVKVLLEFFHCFFTHFAYYIQGTLAVKLRTHQINRQRVRCDDKQRIRIFQRKISHFLGKYDFVFFFHILSAANSEYIRFQHSPRDVKKKWSSRTVCSCSVW